VCNHDFPTIEYQPNSRIVRKNYNCNKCGAIPTPDYFREQREKAGIVMTEEAKEQILTEAEKTRRWTTEEILNREG